MKYGKKIYKTKERVLLDESKINGRTVNKSANGFLLEAEGGLSHLDKCKQNPDIPLYLTGIIQTGDKPNRNGRIYPWTYLKKEAIRYMDNEVKSGLAYGECFAEGHKILTKEGWFDFKDLKENAVVATINPETKEFEWQQILRKVQYEYEGEMVRLKSKNIDTLVTPDHKFLVYTEKDKTNYQSVYAKDLNSSHLIPTKSIWKGELPENIVIENEYGKIELPVKEYCQFLGWYISEGWFCFNEQKNIFTVSISQSKIEEIEEIKQLVEKFGLKYTTCENSKRKSTEHTFCINNKVLAFYLKDFGKSHDKYVPENIKTLPTEYINYFLDTYLKGDGWKYGSHKLCATVSIKLAGDILELFQKTGNHGRLTYREQYATFYVIENLTTGEQKEVRDIIFYTHKEYTDFKESFKIVESRREYKGTNIYIISRKQNDKISVKTSLKEPEYYKGMVYCVTTPNHTIYVSNNGFPFWSNQCDHPESSATPSLSNAALIIEDISFKEKDVIAKIRVLNAFMPDSAPGKKIRGFLLNGKNVGISSRSLGSLEQYTETEYDVVAEDMELVCWDFVSNASNFGSEKLNLIESSNGKLTRYKKSKLLYESEISKIEKLTESEKIYLNVLGFERFLKTKNILG